MSRRTGKTFCNYYSEDTPRPIGNLRHTYYLDDRTGGIEIAHSDQEALVSKNNILRRLILGRKQTTTMEGDNNPASRKRNNAYWEYKKKDKTVVTHNLRNMYPPVLKIYGRTFMEEMGMKI